ncbi:MAG: hypothetical protein ABI665_15120 [Vicinamibacterales bacterium]
MPEPIDFAQLAFKVAVMLMPDAEAYRVVNADHIEAALRQVWNARGAADMEKLQPTIRHLNDLIQANISNDLRSLDQG